MGDDRSHGQGSARLAGPATASHESFDERAECLRCVALGTGCKVAPRALSMKLARVARLPGRGAEPAVRGPELEVKRESFCACGTSGWLEASSHFVRA
eukprot:5130562-Pyramimonas_sp.AAC.1